jgi:hypothetical protein
MRWVTWGTWAALAAVPLWAVAGAAVMMWTGGGDGMAYAVVGGALLCLAAFAAGSRFLERARVRDARDAGAAG